MDLVSTLKIQGWYAYVAVGLMVLLQVARKSPLSAHHWQKIPEGYRFLPGLLIGFATAFVAAFMRGLPAPEALQAGLGGVLAITAPAMGLAAGLKESPIPWDGGAGGKVSARKLILPST